MDELDEVAARFELLPPDLADAQELAQIFQEFAKNLAVTLPAGRNLVLMLTNLEQAELWALKALAQESD